MQWSTDVRQMKAALWDQAFIGSRPRHAWWPSVTFDDFGHCHYDREDTDWPSEPQLVSNSISSVH